MATALILQKTFMQPRTQSHGGERLALTSHGTVPQQRATAWLDDDRTGYVETLGPSSPCLEDGHFSGKILLEPNTNLRLMRFTNPFPSQVLGSVCGGLDFGFRVTHIAGITATVPVASGWRLDWWNDGALGITLTNLAHIDHSSAASRVISRRGQGCTRTTRRAHAKNSFCIGSQVETTSFTGQTGEVVPLPA